MVARALERRARVAEEGVVEAEAVRDLGLEAGALAVAIVKATNVIVETPQEH